MGPSIAQDMLAGIRSYRKLAKRHHVGFTIISKIKAILFTEEKPLAQVAVALTTDDFEDTAGEKADQVLLAALYEIARYSGKLSKTESAIWLRDIIKALLPLMMKYGAENATGNPLDAILEKMLKEAKDKAWQEGYVYCTQNNHEQLGTQKYNDGYQRGKEAGEKNRDEWTVNALRQQVLADMTSKGVVPLTLAMNLRNQINRIDRHLVQECPYCGHVLTPETCNLPMKLTDEQKQEIAVLRKKRRMETHKFEDPSPFDQNLPSYLAAEVYDYRKDDLAYET